MEILKINELTKHYKSKLALDHVTFSVEDGEFLSILGPSGCGKTTLLRLLIGLISPDSGQILLEGKDITHASPDAREMGIVFQNYALFENMTALRNVSYAMKFKPELKSDAEKRAEEPLRLVAFMLYIRNFTYPLQNISQALQSVQSMAAACQRVFEFLDEEEMADEREKTTRLQEVKGNVAFNHVRFGYNPDKIIIKDFSNQVKAGQKIAIVGPTGAGKTTIVNLLMRFYEVNSGSISIDGIPTTELTRENLHELFGMVLQDTWMFEGTVRENLVYNKQNVSDEKLDEVCRAVGLIDLIDQLPHRYDTLLSDNASISAGQKQLFTIARAMLEDAPLMILDEATSSVDTRTELHVQQAMDLLTQGRTSFIIAHRLSTIKNADCILVMKDGDIIEYGNHETLMAKGGFYADLYNSQFEQAS